MASVPKLGPVHPGFRIYFFLWSIFWNLFAELSPLICGWQYVNLLMAYPDMIQMD